MLQCSSLFLVIFVYSNMLFLLVVQMMYSVQILNQQVYEEILIQQPPAVMISTLAVHRTPTGQIMLFYDTYNLRTVRFYEDMAICL